MTCGVAEFQPGGWLGLHRHAPAEIYYVLVGAGSTSLEGREIPLKAGSAVFIPGMAEHGIRQTGNETLRVFYAFPVNSFDGVEYLFFQGATQLTVVPAKPDQLGSEAGSLIELASPSRSR